MRLSRPLLASISAFVALAPSAHAQAFRGLGFLPGSMQYSQAFGVSGDGTTVVGESNSQAFRWRAASPYVLEPLGFLAGGVSSSAKGISADGSILVGKSDSSEGLRAVRWTTPTGPVSLGTLASAPTSQAAGCSADGSVVVGWSGDRGFRWTEAAGMVQLETLPIPGKAAEAYAVSADGMVAVGRSGCCDANYSAVEAVRWPNGGTVAEGLGDLLPTSAPWSAAAGVSADGLVVVGGGTPFAAFGWSGGGPMTQLTPSLPNESCAMDASGDGSVVVGGAGGGAGSDPIGTPVNSIFGARAFVWTAASGMQDLKLLLTALGLSIGGWDLEIATGISDDGNVIVGYGKRGGVREAWVAALSGTPFPTEEDDPAPVPPYVFATRYFGLRESHGFVWHPSTGPRPILPDPPPFVLGPEGEAGVRWVEGAVAPRSSEQLWAVLSDTRTGAADLRLLRHDGRGWSVGWTSAGPNALLGSRGFDVVYEDLSGDALAVYENGAGTPRYRTYKGGVWSEERALPRRNAPRGVANVDEGLVRWIELAARPGTDEIALAYVDERGKLLAWTWNGSRWLSESAALLADDVRSTPGGIGSRAFDIAYETHSGVLLAAWSRRRQDGFSYARRRSGDRGWGRPAGSVVPGLGVEFVDLAAEPASNLVAGVFVGREARRGGPATEQLGLSTWDSERWRHMRRRERPHREADDPLPGLPAAVGWAGASGVALAVYAGQERGTLDWAQWTAEAGWSAEPDVEVPRKGLTRSVRLASSSDSGPLLVLADDDAGLHAFHYHAARAWPALGDSPFAGELAAPDALPFDVAVGRELVLLVGDPHAGRCQHARLHGEGSVELLSFSLVPRGDANRVDALAFTLDEVEGIRREDWSRVELVVDDDGNGTVDGAETTTVAGRGYADPLGRLVFSQSFDVRAPTHYVLRATLPALDRSARVTVSLPAMGVVTPGGVAAGNAVRELAARRARECQERANAIQALPERLRRANDH